MPEDKFQPDPGNSDPEAFTQDFSEEELSELQRLAEDHLLSLESNGTEGSEA